VKNVLLFVHDDSGQEARLQSALDLTRALSGHLNCIDVTPLPLVADPMWGAGAATLVYDETEREAANGDRVQARLDGEDVAWSWEALRGDFVSCLTGAMGAADVVVLNRALDDLPSVDMRNLVGDLLTRNAVLVVAVPPDAKGFDVSAPALIAWDGSPTALRALQRAVPLVALSSSVTILQVGDPAEGAIPAQDAASYLARHGIKPEIEIVACPAVPSAEIARTAGRIGAGYCVMGAFGHSRLREALFGGVTREMLSTGGLPLVLGH
jgi:nucleotide-binding universal stress UspA family protein